MANNNAYPFSIVNRPLVDLSPLEIDERGDVKRIVITEQSAEEESIFADIRLIVNLLTRDDYQQPFRSFNDYQKSAPRRPPPLPDGAKFLRDFLLRFLGRYCQKLNFYNIQNRLSPRESKFINFIEEKNCLFQQSKGYSLFEEAHEIPQFYNLFLDEEQADYFNNLTNEARSILLSCNTKELEKSYKRNSSNCAKSFIEGCRVAFEKNCKNLVFRIDLYPRRKTNQLPCFYQLSSPDISLLSHEVQTYRASFVKHLKKTFGNQLAFFAWKIEFGTHRGFHIHFFIILNGNKYQNVHKIIWLLGEAWGKITNNRGFYYDPTGLQKIFDTTALGMHSTTDQDLWLHIEKIAKYFVKFDRNIKLAFQNNKRSFGCSKSPSAPKKQKPGPKRKMHVRG